MCRIVDKKGMVDAVEEMRKRLAVHAGEGYTHKVTYDGDSRDLAKSVLDRLVGSVVEEERQRRAKETDEAKRFLQQERERADQELKEKESLLSAFLTKHPQLAAEAGGLATTGGLIRAADRERAGEGGGRSPASSCKRRSSSSSSLPPGCLTPPRRRAHRRSTGR